MRFGSRGGGFVLALSVLASCQRSGASSANQRAQSESAAIQPIASSWQPVAAPTEPGPAVSMWEAEAPVTSDFPAHHSFEPHTEKERSQLGDGAWLGADEAKQPLFAEYRVVVPKDASYRLFARKFWKHCPFRWRFDDGGWKQVTRDVALLDADVLRPRLTVSWIELGATELVSGPHRLRIEIDEGTRACAFDRFALSSGDFEPRGNLEPGQPYPAAAAGYHDYDPQLDPFRATAIDLRHLNQSEAGSDGFVRVRQGNLVFDETGQPVRFFGVDSDVQVLALSEAAQRRFARRLAKAGVNLVRLHGKLTRDDDLGTIEPARVLAVQRLSNALRGEGIYLWLSIYYPRWFPLRPRDGFAGYDGSVPFGLVYFQPKLQQLQRDWWRQLLTTPNPKTGMALAKDPALAGIELVNEDSLLFSTFKPYETVPEAQMAPLEQRFAGWLVEKYGSLESAFAAYGGESVRGDDRAQARAGLLDPWHIVQRPSARARDTAQFLATVMRDYYRDANAYLKKELGLEALTTCSNWQTANERVLGPLDDWANAVCDVMDRHAYFSGPIAGEGASHVVQPGQRFDDRSALQFDFDASRGKAPSPLSFLEPRVNGKPSMTSEVGWPWPNRFRAEAPLLTAAYASLHDHDGLVFFETTSPYGARQLTKFEVGDPTIFGQFPAAALAYRRAMLRPAQPVASIGISTRSLFELKGLPTAHAAHERRGLLEFGAAIDSTSPLLPLVGPTDVAIGDPARDSARLEPLATWLDQATGNVNSRTGQLRWDTKGGVLMLRAPQLQGAVGFLRQAGRIQLPDVTMTIENEFASVVVVALDGQPISSSTDLLIQAMTEATNRGWASAGSPQKTIESIGESPIVVRDIRGTVELPQREAAIVRVTALDDNGYPLESLVGNGFRLWPKSEYFHVQVLPCASASTLASSQAAPPCRPASAQ